MTIHNDFGNSCLSLQQSSAIFPATARLILQFPNFQAYSLQVSNKLTNGVRKETNAIKQYIKMFTTEQTKP